VGKILEIPSFGKTFSGVPSKIFLSLLKSIGLQLLPVEFWLRPHQWCPPVDWSSAPTPSSVNAVNDVSLPTNLGEVAQQSSGTNKNFLFGVHTCMCVFASVENSVMSITNKGSEEKQQLFSKRKSPNCSTVLVINFSIS